MISITVPVGTIGAFPFCSVDCCGGRGVFEIYGPGYAVSGGSNDGTYRACDQEPEHLGRLVANMLRHTPASSVTITRANWARSTSS